MHNTPNPRMPHGQQGHAVNLAAETPVPNGSGRYVSKPKEVAFVEDRLRLPEAWGDADGIMESLGQLYGRQTMLSAQISQLDARIEEVKLNIINGVAAKIAESDANSPKPLSEAAKDRRIETALRNDGDLKEMNGKLRELRDELHAVDNDIRVFELRHRTVITRVNSQIAVLDFYRSARDAQTLEAQRKPY